MNGILPEKSREYHDLRSMGFVAGHLNLAEYQHMLDNDVCDQ